MFSHSVRPCDQANHHGKCNDDHETQVARPFAHRFACVSGDAREHLLEGSSGQGFYEEGSNRADNVESHRGYCRCSLHNFRRRVCQAGTSARRCRHLRLRARPAENQSAPPALAKPRPCVARPCKFRALAPRREPSRRTRDRRISLASIGSFLRRRARIRSVDAGDGSTPER